MQLYDQFGRLIKKEKLPDRRPLAAAPILDSWREYVADGLTPATLATIFKEADAGDVRRQAELFEQIEEKDGHAAGEMSKRKNVILDMEFKISPATEDSRDVKVAEFVEEHLDNMTDYEDVLVSLQDAVGKGYSALSIDWDISEGQALPQSLEFIEQKRFLFTDETGYVNRTPRLITDDDPMGIEIPAWKMLFHRYGGKSGHPTRSGIYRVCAWMYLFKNYSIKDWVIFCEVYGMPLRLGKYDPSVGDEDKSALVTAIQSLGSDAAGIISKNTEIEFIKAVEGRATGELYRDLADFCNRENSKAILGQTLSAEVGDKGSYAASKTHNDVRLDLLKADGRAAVLTVRYQLIRPIVGFNFGWDTPCPKYKAVLEEADDLNKKAEWVTELIDRNVEMPVSFVRKEFNIPEPKNGESVVVPPTAGAPYAAKHRRITAKSRRYTPEQEKVDELVEESTQRAARALSGVMEPIRAMVMKAKSLEDLRENLFTVYADMKPDELEELMVQAMYVAELYGRSTVV